MFKVIIVLTNIYSLLSNYLNAFIYGVLSKYSAPSHHIISSPWLSAFCFLPFHTILGPQLPPPPEYAVKLCFPLLEVPVPRLPTLLSDPVTEEGCLLRLAGDDCLTALPGAKALCNEGHGYQEKLGWHRAISQLSLTACDLQTIS